MHHARTGLSLLVCFGLFAGCGGGGGSSGGGGTPAGNTGGGGGGAGDLNEPNDSAAAATAITLPHVQSGLSIHTSGDIDVFSFNVAQAGDLDVRLNFLHSQGDLSLELQQAGGSSLGAVNSADDDERLQLSLAAGSYLILVRGQGAATNVYNLTVNFVIAGGGGGGGTPDALETNDSALSASLASLPFAQSGLSIHNASDLDYFLVNLSQAATLEAELSFSHSAGDLNLELQANNGGVLASSTSTSDDESISHSLLAGNYLVVVRGLGGATNTSYTLAIDTLTGGGGGGLSADANEPNDSIGGATGVTLPHGQTGLSVDTAGDEDFFALAVNQAVELSAAIDFSHASGNLDLELLDGSSASLAAATSSSDDESLQQIVLPGTYYVRVFGVASAVNLYDLAISRVPSTAMGTSNSPDLYEPNDSTGTAFEIPALPFNDCFFSIHSGSDQDYFRFSLPAPGNLNINVLFSDAAGDVDIQLLNSSGQGIETAQSTSDNEIINRTNQAAGTYYLRVYGWNGAQNVYDISLGLGSSGPGGGSTTSTLFSDLYVESLQNPSLFNDNGGQSLAFESNILNIGTAPAPGAAVGNALATFRVQQRDVNGNVTVLVEGQKGPIFLTNNGGNQRPEIHDQWVAAGSPMMPGSNLAPTFTDPGWVDFYTAGTNNSLTTKLNITNLPAGDYEYELHIDPQGSYAYEPAFAKANNRGWVPITIGGTPGGTRTVSVAGVLQRSASPTVSGGVMSTLVGNGAALSASLGNSFDADATGVERTWGVNLDSSGTLFFTLWDDGSFWELDSGSGNALLRNSNLNLPMVFDFLSNGDVVVADFGNNRVALLDASNNYADSALSFPGFSITEPTAVHVGPSGLVYVCNSGGHEILELNMGTGVAQRVVGTGVQGFSGDGGPATAAQLSYPIDLDITSAGVMVIADGHNNRLRAVNLNSVGSQSLCGTSIGALEIATLAGDGPTSTVAGLFQNGTDGFAGDARHGFSAILDWPFAPREHNGRVYFLDADNHRVRVLDEWGYLHTLAGDAPLPASNGLRPFGSFGQSLGDGGSGLTADVNRPMDLQVRDNPGGGVDLYLGDTDFYRIRKLTGVDLVE